MPTARMANVIDRDGRVVSLVGLLPDETR